MDGVTQNSTAADRNKELINSVAEERAQRSWNDQAKKVLLDLNSSSADILSFVTKELEGGSASPAKQNAISFLLSERTQMTALISNVLRMLADAANQIIRNMRA